MTATPIQPEAARLVALPAQTALAGLEPGQAVAGALHLVPGAGQLVLEHRPLGGVVLDDEDGGLGHAARPGPF